MQSLLFSSRPHTLRVTLTASKRFNSSQAEAGGSFVKRLTFFKVAKEEDIQAVLKAYEILRSKALRVSQLSSFSWKQCEDLPRCSRVLMLND